MKMKEEIKTQALLKEALVTIEALTRKMSSAKDMIIDEHGPNHPTLNVLSYDVEEICNQIESAVNYTCTVSE